MIKNQAVANLDYKSDGSQLAVNNETQILDEIKSKKILKVMQ